MKNQHTELQPFRKTHRASKPKTSEKGRSPACLHYEQPPERPNRKQITARRDGLDVFFAHPSGSVVPNVKLWGKRHPTKITKTNHPEGNWKTTLVQNPWVMYSRWYGDTEESWNIQEILTSFAIAISSASSLLPLEKSLQQNTWSSKYLENQYFNSSQVFQKLPTHQILSQGFHVRCLHQASAPRLVIFFSCWRHG